MDLQNSNKVLTLLGALILELLHLVANVVFWSLDTVKFYRKSLRNWLVSPPDLTAFRREVDGLGRRPAHLAFCLVEDPGDVSWRDLGKLTAWTLAAGVRRVTLYDPRGHLKRRRGTLMESVRAAMIAAADETLIPKKVVLTTGGGGGGAAGENNNGNGNAVVGDRATVNLVSLEDGRPDLVSVARSLARDVSAGEISLDNIVEDEVSSRLGSGDPDLLVRLGSLDCNLGFLPWQIRLTEIHSIESHRHVEVSELLRVLRRFSQCEQRFGR